MNTHPLPASVKNLATELETLWVMLGGDPGEFVAEPGYTPVCEVEDADEEMIELLARLHALTLLSSDDLAMRAVLSEDLPSMSQCEHFDRNTSGKSMAEIVEQAVAWVCSLER